MQQGQGSAWRAGTCLDGRLHQLHVSQQELEPYASSPRLAPGLRDQASVLQLAY